MDILFQFGLAGAVIYWFAMRFEQKSDKVADEIKDLAEAIRENTEVILMLIMRQPDGDAQARSEAENRLGKIKKVKESGAA